MAGTKIKSSFDLPLIRTLGKAFYWQRLLDTGAVANATDLARRFKLEPGWVDGVALHQRPYLFHKISLAELPGTDVH